MQRQLVALACSGLLMTLAACGGGGEPIGGNTVFVQPPEAAPVSADAITQTLTVVTASEQPVFTMALPADVANDAALGSASSTSLSDGTRLTQTVLTGTYAPASGDTQTVQLQVTYVPDVPTQYIIGLSFGSEGAKRTCISSGNWSDAQLAAADADAAGATQVDCDGTVTIDAQKGTVVAKDVTTLTDAGAAVKVNFALTLPQP